MVLVGDPGVGKTNILAYFTSPTAIQEDAALQERASKLAVKGVLPTSPRLAHSFNPMRKPTIGVEFGTKVIVHPKTGKKIKVQIWDTGNKILKKIQFCNYL